MFISFIIGHLFKCCPWRADERLHEPIPKLSKLAGKIFINRKT